MGFPQGPEHSCGLLTGLYDPTAQPGEEKASNTTFAPVLWVFCLGSNGKICYLKSRPLTLVPFPTNHPDSCFKYNCPSGVTCPLRREGC